MRRNSQMSAQVYSHVWHSLKLKLLVALGDCWSKNRDLCICIPLRENTVIFYGYHADVASSIEIYLTKSLISHTIQLDISAFVLHLIKSIYLVSEVFDKRFNVNSIIYFQYLTNYSRKIIYTNIVSNENGIIVWVTRWLSNSANRIVEEMFATELNVSFYICHNVIWTLSVFIYHGPKFVKTNYCLYNVSPQKWHDIR